MTIPLMIRRHITLLGAPGSGKGSYGRLLAKRWGMELISVSDVLRQSRSHLMQQQARSGTLMDDQMVSDVLREHLLHKFEKQQQQLEQNSPNHPINNSNETTTTTATPSRMIVDGFPRTLRQIQLMEEQWPPELQISLAVHLDVPAVVCQQKLLGRRYCTICGGNFNTSHVQHGEFDLPATLPQSITKTTTSIDNNNSNNNTRANGS